MPEYKYKHLLEILQKFDKIGVAYSGGVDSTLLLHGAIEALGPDKVIGLFIYSRLQSGDSIESSRKVFYENFPKDSKLQEVKMFPLTWPEFIINDDKRCYFCKTRMYTSLQTAMVKDECYVLVDGTNVDDLKEDRPGLQAIRELGVLTPLVDAGLTKDEIRRLAEMKGLSNFDLPSNSCLATRIEKDRTIDVEKLRLIEDGERFLSKLGFSGCRVRLLNSFTLIEIQSKQLETFMKPTNRANVENYFKKMGFARVVLSLEGR